MIRILVADDSRTARDLIVSLLREDADNEIVGEARDGVEAVELARALHPDVVTMDVSMPRMSGLDAVAAIMADAPARILVVCSVGDEHAVDLSFRAVAAGALELVPKVRAEGPDEVRAWGRLLREAVRLMAEVPVVRRRRATVATTSRAPSSAGRIDALGIAASTGGPPAVAAILSELRGGLAVPIFVAQHVAPGFSEGLRRWLAGASSLSVVTPSEGTVARAAHVYLAPDDRDLVVDAAGVLHLVASRSLHRPSATSLFVSMVAAYGARAGALVLTGMGDDGAAGVRAILHAGGVALAQDEASSVVFGMPRAARDAGASVVALSELADRIRTLAAPAQRKR